MPFTPITSEEPVLYLVTSKDAKQDGTPLLETSSFDNLAAAMDYAYTQNYREENVTLSISEHNLTTGDIKQLLNARQLLTEHRNREHDEQMEEDRWNSPQEDMLKIYGVRVL